MGYPMTYDRVVNRNQLQGDYTTYNGDDPRERALSMIRGDLRRLESDQRDERHLKMYAEKIGITADQVRAVLDAFFKGDW